MIVTKLLKARFMALLSLVIVMSLAVFAVVQASTPIPTEGDWTAITTEFEFEVVGQNLFYSAVADMEFTGSLIGTAVLVESGVEHGGGEGPLVARGVIHFTGSIDGSDEGSIDMKYTRIKDGGLSSPISMEGKRVFDSKTGTGGLANMHGTAHFDGALGVGTYEGQYHFE